MVGTKVKKNATKLPRQSKVTLGDQTVPINFLHLDPLNPRHDPLEGDAEVIAELCTKEFISEMARDIARRGSLSPLDVMGVVPLEGHPGHFTVVEGNRRACALILLADPKRAPTTALQAQLSKLATEATVPRQIKVHVFGTRAEAKPWIDLRHLGAQGGVGIREWNPEQQSRAAGNNTRTSARANNLALAVLDRLVQTKLLTPEQRAKVSLTTITRYLGTPGVRAIIGLGSASELVYTHDPAEVDQTLLQLVLDSIEGPKQGEAPLVNSRSGSAERLAYAHQLKDAGVAPSRALPAPVAPPDPKATVRPGIKDEPRQRSSKDPSKIPTLFDSSFLVKHKDPVLLRLRTECITLQLDHFGFSGNYLLRAIVEQIMTLFAKKRGKWNQSLNDEKLTQLCAAELKDMGISGKALTNISKAAGNSATPYSLHSLGHAVHGGTIPTRKELRAYADTWAPSLRAMLDAL
ncbi:hypothetical protein [Herbaspirillum rubrisubalbicans]|uniref:hypothetical protein n=1 Tax=Herbaspirillum rubrisubalbicans TaxID=80842 RepID=UPI00030B66B2|nr:hypothetical protein [Herbaspirillum rubrisubalbicans]